VEIDGTGRWQLQLWECYGHLHVSLPFNTSNTSLIARNASSVGLQLLHDDGENDKPKVGTLLLSAESGEVPVSYQLELHAPSSQEQDHFVLPEPVLHTKRTLQGLEVSFQPPNISGHSLQGAANSSFQYTLLALLKSDPQVNSNSSCGIEQALHRGLAIANVTRSQPAVERVSGDWQADQRLTMVLPPFQDEVCNQSLWVNVLVEFVGSDSQRLAVLPYSSLTLGKSANCKRTLALAAKHRAGLVVVVILGVLSMVTCWASGFPCCSGNDVQPHSLKDAVELELHYDLTGELMKETPSRPSGVRSGYVPPNV